MIIVTGGAGLIGSSIIWSLNKAGRTDILVVDDLDHPEKERNLKPLSYERIVGIAEFRKQLIEGAFDAEKVEAIIHMGACSSTLEQNWDYLLDNNVNYTKDIVEWCVRVGVRCIYASSAATYGDGSNGYSDDHALIPTLQPLNLYGRSKLDVDKWALSEGHLDRVVGLRYFNVFGPNEWHKGDMRSVVAKKYEDVAENGYIELFKSDRPEYADGEQKRDFIYVKVAATMTLFFLKNTEAAGIFNVGSGVASSWNELAKGMFDAVGKDPDIRYVEMSDTLRAHYQYFTQAEMHKLRAAGWDSDTTPLSDAVGEYVREYLIPNIHLS